MKPGRDQERVAIGLGNEGIFATREAPSLAEFPYIAMVEGLDTAQGLLCGLRFTARLSTLEQMRKELGEKSVRVPVE